MDKKYLQEKVLEAKYQPSEWINVLREWFGAKQLNQIPPAISRDTNDWSDYVENAFELGRLFTDDGEREVGIFEVNLTQKAWLERNRVKLRSLLSNIYGNVDGALIVFTQGDKWRFSYVSEILERDANDNVVAVKTEPKRFTYLFGDGENCRTAAMRFEKLRGKAIALADLNEAFSVEKLNKDFFKTYKEFFEKFWKYLAENKQYRRLLEDAEQTIEEKKTKPIRDFVKILLGRLVFLQFLQKKGWMGVSANRADWTGGDVKFIQNLFNEFSDKQHFHSTALKTLFFETLNRKRASDLAPAILGANIKIPYLNGGLFDADVSAENAIDFPAEYFRDLLDFFEQYNFTIDESDALDREVGIDPEMLGHIFENLLEENREKGAFYTPKEIVHYMCQESLIEYLSTRLLDELRVTPSGVISPIITPEGVTLNEVDFAAEAANREAKAGVEQLVRHNIVSKPFAEYKRANEINNLLKQVKICDPAIGSGAFPMGLLKEIFECRRVLYGYLKTNEAFNPATVKKEIIQNNIYGVDIEPGAVDIARLRFWLALVVDEIEPSPLPNLDYKIMQGNSLLERFEDIDLSNLVSAEDSIGGDLGDVMISEQSQFGFGEGFAHAEQMQLTVFDRATKEQLQNLIERYFDLDEWNRRTNEKLDKAELKRQINGIVEGKIHAFIYAEKKRLEREVKKYEKKWIDADFADFSKLSQSSKEFKAYLAVKRKFEQAGETETRLIAMQHKPERPYFLWHLWFKDVFERGGFDIFIGNPPYIQLQKMAEQTAALERAGFQTFARTGDIYCLFYEQANKFLKPGGTLCYITSNKWMRADYGEKLRGYFLTKANPLKLVDFGGNLVFETATVDTNIFISKKADYQNQIQTCFIRRDYGYKNGESLADYFDQNSFVVNNFDENSWVVLDKETLAIKQFVEAQGETLSKWNLQIYRGVLTGFDEAFVIDGEVRKRLTNKDKKNVEIIKPLLRGKDIKRGSLSLRIYG